MANLTRQVRLISVETFAFNAGKDMQYDFKFRTEDDFPFININMSSYNKTAFKVGKEYTLRIGSKV